MTYFLGSYYAKRFTNNLVLTVVDHKYDAIFNRKYHLKYYLTYMLLKYYMKILIEIF